jgi:hypothetical protein
MLVMAWAASLSIGYNTPALVSGPMLTVLLASACPVIRKKIKTSRLYTAALVAVTIAILLAFGVARTQTIYRESNAAHLTWKLDGILPGGKGIRTNSNTYRFLADLSQATRRAKENGVTYAVLPDCAGWWVQASSPNPLSIDWVHKWELNSPPLHEKVIADLEAHRGSNWVIIPKVAVPLLASGLHPFQDRYVDYVRSHFEKVDDTEFLEIYR